MRYRPRSHLPSPPRKKPTDATILQELHMVQLLKMHATPCHATRDFRISLIQMRLRDKCKAFPSPPRNKSNGQDLTQPCVEIAVTSLLPVRVRNISFRCRDSFLLPRGKTRGSDSPLSPWARGARREGVRLAQQIRQAHRA
jgi:hypothetical protein